MFRVVSRKFPTLESFVAAAKEKHGNLYTYPDQPWPPVGQAVGVVCKQHGEFHQRYLNHVRGAGCPICWESRRGKALRLTSEDVEKAIRKVFPEYAVDASSYSGNRSKLEVCCPSHGKFLANYSDLVRGHGCPKCGKIKSRESKVAASKERMRSDLSSMYPELTFPNFDLEFTSTTARLTIICKKHGESTKRAHEMVNKGEGCPSCGKESSIAKRRVSKDEAISRFISVHGNTYDYSKFRIAEAMGNSTIVCKKHGEFQQTPQAHWTGQGCPLCGVERRASASIIPFDVFVKNAREIHGNRYEYVESTYQGTSKNLTIICKEHGEFSQLAVSHLSGCDCPSCNQNGFNPSKKAHVYVYKITKGIDEFAGFGITNNLHQRDTDHQKTFSEHGAKGELAYKFLYRKGRLAAALESRLISEVPITSTGMTGFIREAAKWCEIGLILSIVESHHQEFKGVP